MGKHEQGSLTPLEASVMNIAWDASEVTAQQVHEKLQKVKPRAYNTVLTVMRILRRKGLLSSERASRAVVYRPTVTRAETAQQAIKEVTDRFFACSAPALLSHLVRHEALSGQELRAIRRQVDGRLREKGRKSG